MKSFSTDPKAVGGIVSSERPEPVPQADEALIRVTHFSLNRGELHFAATGAPGRPIGWDVAGTIEKAASAGGPPAGTRVVAFSRASRGWAEKVAVPLRDLAVIPEGVESLQAASLPVAALTALYSLERGRRILGSRVLVTGATGGVGNFAVALGALMGGEIVAQVRRQEQVEAVKALGAHQVIVDDSGEKVAAAGPYRLVVDGLGNGLTSRAILALTPDGIAVLYGATDAQTLQVNPGFMLGTGTGRVEGFNLYRESEIESISRGLDRLLKLIQHGRLSAAVDQQATWEQAPQLAQSLLDRKFAGKAVVVV